MNEMQRLLIENECRNLMLRYCQHLDHLDPEAFADLYTEDAVYQPAAVPEPLCGRAAINKWISSYPRERLARHISTNQIVEVIDEARARGSSYAIVFRGSQPVAGEVSPNVTPRSVVEYADSFRRTSAGWRIASRIYTFQFLQEAGNRS